MAREIDIEEVETRRVPGRFGRLFALVSWPSFLVAAVAETVFFSLINPRELYLLGEPVHFSPLATYTIGFFGFWCVAGASSLISSWMAEKMPACADRCVGRK
ncbi:hypothetical protein [Methyloversatilis discipulorum]|uniref:hypothetical protein n=1 Tax=Methyloversatilis TaxID=378210 RepID=UPI0026EFA92D|nr:hypothetical protein [Methyloversatilis discipulorum]MBT9517716.1 hypothetical protein [Methyloversatilis discipulorum]